MKARIATMDKTGDSAQTFDLDDPAAKAAAQAAIDKARQGGALIATAPGDGKPGEIVRKAEDLAEENVIVPGIVAG